MLSTREKVKPDRRPSQSKNSLIHRGKKRWNGEGGNPGNQLGKFEADKKRKRECRIARIWKGKDRGADGWTREGEIAL